MTLRPADAASMPVTLSDLLASREQRQTRQRDWLSRHRLPLVSFTVISPGPVKDSELTRRIFNAGLSALAAVIKDSGWHIQAQRASGLATGPEALFAVTADAAQLKQAVMTLEEQHPTGRLWDIDVLTPDGNILSRTQFSLAPRCCLLCGENAAVCARARTHTTDELISRMEVLLHDAALCS